MAPSPAPIDVSYRPKMIQSYYENGSISRRSYYIYEDDRISQRRDTIFTINGGLDIEYKTVYSYEASQIVLLTYFRWSGMTEFLPGDKLVYKIDGDKVIAIEKYLNAIPPLKPQYISHYSYDESHITKYYRILFQTNDTIGYMNDSSICYYISGLLDSVVSYSKYSSKPIPIKIYREGANIIKIQGFGYLNDTLIKGGYTEYILQAGLTTQIISWSDSSGQKPVRYQNFEYDSTRNLSEYILSYPSGISDRQSIYWEEGKGNFDFYADPLDLLFEKPNAFFIPK